MRPNAAALRRERRPASRPYVLGPSAYRGGSPFMRPAGRPGLSHVLDGELLVGEYPTPDDATWLRDQHGVSTVVCLQDEFDLAGLAKVPSSVVRPPRVAAAPIAMESRLVQHSEMGAGPVDVFFLEVVRFHLADGVLDADGLPDPRLLDATGRLGGESYCGTADVFRVPRPVR